MRKLHGHEKLLKNLKTATTLDIKAAHAAFLIKKMLKMKAYSKLAQKAGAKVWKQSPCWRPESGIILVVFFKLGWKYDEDEMKLHAHHHHHHHFFYLGNRALLLMRFS